MSRWNARFSFAFVIVVATFLSEASAQDQEQGHFQEMNGKDLFERKWEWQGPSPQPSEAVVKRFQEQSRNRLFASAIEGVVGDGLGPLHNATSCVDCHVGGGGSGVQHNVTLITIDPRSEILKTPTQEGLRTIVDFFPGVLSGGGSLSLNTVVHNHSTREGYAPLRSRLASYVPGGIDESWFEPEKRTVEAIAEQPVIAGRYKTIDYYVSQRNTPALWGIGVIDEIAPVRLRKLATKQAKETNGRVTGRLAGKFGWRGQVRTLSQFVVGACAGELGLNQISGAQAHDPTNRTYANLGEDITAEETWRLTNFVAEIPRPIEKPLPQHSLGDVLEGEKHFRAVGCTVCHVPDLHPTSGMFSDLLLHDMGEELQAAFPAPAGELENVRFMNASSFPPYFPNPSLAPGYYGSDGQISPPESWTMTKPVTPQFPRGKLTAEELLGAGALTWDALQREWRTPPLWGVADTAPYLHDGRAATLEQAILWHGGEAMDSQEAFVRLDRVAKDEVIAFLSSLRAPKTTIGSP